MPLLAVLGVGASSVSPATSATTRSSTSFFHDDWNLSWKGAGASLAAGAVALPAVLFGSGVLAAASGVELTSLAMGGATAIAGATTGAIEDPSKKVDSPAPVQKAPVQTAPATTAPVDSYNPFADAAAVTTASDNEAPVGDLAPVSSSANATLDVNTAPVESASAPVNDPAQPIATNPDPYTVKRGDTLTKIARENGVSLADLEKANPQLADRQLPAAYKSPWDFIRTGEQIAIPSKTPGVKKALDKIGDPVPGTDQ